MSDFLLYGSYGYTGSLIAELAVQQGLKPLLAGRNPQRVQAQAQRLGLQARAFPLEDAPALDAALSEAPLILHLGGPYHRTYRMVADACLRTRRHYLDVTGEISVFEGLAALGPAAQQAGIMLLPGVGFDVVPSDCLAAHLKNRLPTATHLRLAIRSLGGGLSHGTALTMVEGLHRPGAVRRDGQVIPVPQGWQTIQVDFGRGPRPALSFPWGDVSTAYYTTGIPNIEVYMAVPVVMRALVKIGRYAGGLLATHPAQALLRALVKAGPAGPSAEARQRGRSLLYGEVTDAQGQRAAARLSTPEGYALTVRTALEIVRRVLLGESQPGFCTPAGLYGADFILQFDADRQDI